MLSPPDTISSNKFELWYGVPRFMHDFVISICAYRWERWEQLKGILAIFASHPIPCNKSVHAWRTYISHFHHPTSNCSVQCMKRMNILYYGRNNGKGIIWLTRHQSVECRRKKYASRVIDWRKKKKRKKRIFPIVFPFSLVFHILWLMHNMLFLYRNRLLSGCGGGVGGEEHKNHELRWNLLWESISGRLTKGF